MFWGISSIGRVRALQARGTGIETPMLQLTFNFYILGGVCIYFRRSCEIFFNLPWIRFNGIPRISVRAPGLDGRAVQGARLKFESLRRRGFESHSKQPRFFIFFFSPAAPQAVTA